MSTSYIATVPGLLKIVEAVLCLGGFISAMIPYQGFTQLGGGWTQFVTITALFGVVGILIAKTFMEHKLPPTFPLLVLVFYLVYDVFLLIAGILTAVRAGQFYNVVIRSFGYAISGTYQAIAAAAFFVLVAFLVFVIDTILSLSAWRASSSETTTHSSSSHTTTTSTTKTTVVVS